MKKTIKINVDNKGIKIVVIEDKITATTILTVKEATKIWQELESAIEDVVDANHKKGGIYG